jgi:membrane protein CcdC involved in cytochrome C biogenesis
MKSRKVIDAFVIGIISVVLIGATSSFAAKGGRLMVKRSANFGERVSLSLSVDGKQIARLVSGRTYNGYLTPGRHVISATVVPNMVYSPVWQKEINVQSGQTYSFTGIWQGTKMVLVSN